MGLLDFSVPNRVYNNSMSDNQINEMFAYLSKDAEVSSQRVRQLFSAIFRQAKPLPSLPATVSKHEFEQAFLKASQPERIEEELLYLFYHLDRDKKGYLVPEDVMAMFEAIGRKITLNQIENSFKYAKVYKNKMSFQDFKEYYNNF